MDYLLIFLGIVMMIAGLLGCMLPVLPGPPLSYIGMLLLHFSEKYQFSSNFLIGWAVVTIIVYLLDYLIPIWGTKRFGGSKRGIWGSIIGLMIGMFVFPPIGIIVGPFAGAVIGELSDGKQSKEAFRSGLGTFIGFLIGTLLKLIASGMMA
ncbi:DUF456 domain-containing protein [uncultured Sunxiuqinia sp.]|uniref:DUF456 domain-containing protein n=1 Tax=uncultured Sunxiuqinia sp. TaxID=1573825 RepID=UPI002AA6CDAE|nr:DUF456 domain-containing protein [uncultured Sunxiuqinia sp.]